MLRSLLALLFFCLVLWLAWTLWQPPASSTVIRPAPQALPDRPGEAEGLWRVVTRRMIVPKAADAFALSLRERGLTGIKLARQEEVELHAFDDPRGFTLREDAVAVRDAWKKAGFEAELIRSDGEFGIALGRLYMAAYAQQLQRRLEQSKRPYTYDRHKVLLPTWRYTFTASPYAKARTLWQQVQAMGTADPVLMRQSRFRALFADVAAASR